MAVEGVPLYRQIKADLLEQIKGGQLAPGARIESELELMARYGVSRATVRQALGQLVAEGYLEIRRGLGTYVATPKLEQGLGGFYSFSREIERLGMRPGTRVLGVRMEPATRTVAAALGLPLETPVVALRRLRLADDEPLVAETSYLPAARFPGLAERDFSRRRLYDTLLADYGVRPARAHEVFEPVLLTAEEASLLGKHRGDPALVVERTAFDTTMQPIEFCRSVVRSDRVRYFVDLGEAQA
jgi:GntR family transcriptional regulator